MIFGIGIRSGLAEEKKNTKIKAKQISVFSPFPISNQKKFLVMIEAKDGLAEQREKKMLCAQILFFTPFL